MARDDVPRRAAARGSTTRYTSVAKADSIIPSTSLSSRETTVVRIVVLEGERAERVPQLPHHRGGLNALADDVADDEADRAVLELDDVVPVSADVDADRARQVAGRERDPADRRQALRQDAALHRLRDPALGLVAAGAVERLLALAHQRQQPFPVCVGDAAGGATASGERAARERERDPAVRRTRPAGRREGTP